MISSTDTPTLGELAIEHFEPLVGSRFSVAIGPDESLSLTLTHAGLLRQFRGGAGRQAFSLLFTGPGSSPLRQRTFEFTHAELGTHPIFIVPIQGNAETYTYEAIFS
jgi:hypothetical protein